MTYKFFFSCSKYLCDFREYQGDFMIWGQRISEYEMGLRHWSEVASAIITTDNINNKYQPTNNSNELQNARRMA